MAIDRVERTLDINVETVEENADNLMTTDAATAPTGPTALRAKPAKTSLTLLWVRLSELVGSMPANASAATPIIT